MTDEQLIRILIKETIETELNEFFGNFMKSGQKEDPSVTAAKKTLDAHFSGTMKKDDSIVSNLISKLSPEDQTAYKSKFAATKKQTTQPTQQKPESATQMQMRRNAELRHAAFAENKKRRFAALR